MKTTSPYICSACGHSAPRWFGRCPECNEWSTASEPQTDVLRRVEVRSLGAPGDAPERLGTGLPEVDRVVGGGFVPGEVVLLAGEPGIGKSTLVLQIMDGLRASGRDALLLSGEESIPQVALRARRLEVSADRLRAAAETSLDAIVGSALEESPAVLVVDSVQSIEDPAQNSAPGSLVQVRECAAKLARLAKSTGTVVVLIGHVTKEGTVAGPKTLEHLVDAVLVLDGERTGSLRLLRATKNRFGSCEETGVFLMGGAGLEPVEDASAMLLADRHPGTSGSIVFPGLEGSRPVLVELQALIPRDEVPSPRRVAMGVDGGRLALLLGILSERGALEIGRRDVFAAAAGGLTVKEPAADLALCAAIYSAARSQPLDDRLIALGEVGLAGEVRRVPGIERRLNEACRMGFERALVPRGAKQLPRGIDAVEVSGLNDALDWLTRVENGYERVYEQAG